jgi:hypothetical protein
MVNFLTVAAKHCRRAEHSPQLAAGSFNILSALDSPTACHRRNPTTGVSCQRFLTDIIELVKLSGEIL